MIEKQRRAFETLGDLEFPEPCIVGMQQFMSLFDVLATDGYLVVVSKHLFEARLAARWSRCSLMSSRAHNGEQKPMSQANLGVSRLSSSGDDYVNVYPSIVSRSPRIASPRLGGSLGFRNSLSLTSLILGGGDDDAQPRVEVPLPAPEDVAPSASWNIYVLTPVPTLICCNEMLKAADMHRATDQQIQQLLLLEVLILVDAKVRARGGSPRRAALTARVCSSRRWSPRRRRRAIRWPRWR